MKNYMNYIKSAFLLSLMVTFASCDNEPSVSDVSRVTFFPTFVYDGPATSLIPCNSDYEIPPVTASENGVDLDVTTKVVGMSGSVPSVDITKADIYTETSSAVNADGYAGQVVRTFWVACTGDLVTSIEGLYTSTCVRNGSVTPQYTDMQYNLIRKVGANEYELSDAIGGYYDLGRQYGEAYRAKGMIVTANDIPSNDFSFSGTIGVGAFGGELNMLSFAADPGAGQITFSSDWSFGYVFEVTYTQVPL